MRDSQLAESLGWYQQTVALSKAHPHLKVLLSIGGWSEGSFSFSKLAADYTKRAAFVESVLRILQQYGFHGIDIAWEYPAWTNRGGTPQDKETLPLLVKDLRNALQGEYIFSLTVAGDTHFASPAYNIKALTTLVDQFNIRSFDFAGAWNDKTNHHSPLRNEASLQSVESTVNYYLKSGAPANKLVVGIPLYGRTFLLKEGVQSPPQNGGNDSVYKMSGLGQLANGRFGGNWTLDGLRMGYHEICHEISKRDKNNWQTYWDNFCTVPFARNDKRWVTFDNPESIRAKVSFVLANKLKGVMASSIDTDDFKGTACGSSGSENDREDIPGNEIITYPLLRSINFAFSNEEAEERSRSELHKTMNHSSGPNNNDESILRGKEDPKNQNGDNSGSRSGQRLHLSWSLFVIIAMLTLTSMY